MQAENTNEKLDQFRVAWENAKGAAGAFLITSDAVQGSLDRGKMNLDAFKAVMNMFRFETAMATKTQRLWTKAVIDTLDEYRWLGDYLSGGKFGKAVDRVQQLAEAAQAYSASGLGGGGETVLGGAGGVTPFAGIKTIPKPKKRAVPPGGGTPPRAGRGTSIEDLITEGMQEPTGGGFGTAEELLGTSAEQSAEAFVEWLEKIALAELDLADATKKAATEQKKQFDAMDAAKDIGGMFSGAIGQMAGSMWSLAAAAAAGVIPSARPLQKCCRLHLKASPRRPR